MSDTHLTVFITSLRIRTLARIIMNLGLDGPDDDELQEYMSQLEALGASIDTLAQQIVTLLENFRLEQVKTDTEVAS